MQYSSSSFLLLLGTKNIKMRNKYQKLFKTIEQQALKRNVFYQCSILILLLLLLLWSKNIKVKNRSKALQNYWAKKLHKEMCSIKVVSFFFFFLDLRTSKWRTDQKDQQNYWTATSTKQKMCFYQVLLLLLLLLFSPSSSSSLDPRTSNLRINQKLCKVLEQVLKATGNSI